MAGTPGSGKKLIFDILLFSNKSWANCPDGHFMRGLYRGDGQLLHHIEKGSCCRPNNLPNRYLDCYEKDVEKSFDKKGWGKCAKGYYMAGFYKGTCDKVYCIEKFRCCSMSDDDPLITKDQSSAPLQYNTSLDCGETSKLKTTRYIC